MVFMSWYIQRNMGTRALSTSFETDVREDRQPAPSYIILGAPNRGFVRGADMEAGPVRELLAFL